RAPRRADLPLHHDAGRRLHPRPAARRGFRHRRVALLGSRLQVRARDRRDPRRPGDAWLNPPRHLPVPPVAVRLNPIGRTIRSSDRLHPTARSVTLAAAAARFATQRISRRSGRRFADKDMCQQTERNADGGEDMLGLMQDWPLLIHRIIDHAATYHAGRPIISRSIEGPIHTTTYADIRGRAKKVAQRLARDGVRPGDRVATLAWNTWRHLESWYGIVGIGAVYHTVNPRLFQEQIVWIVNHAEDRVMMTDLTFVPLLEKLADRLPAIERYIVYTDAAHMPKTTLKNAVAYEDWLAEADGDFAWAQFDENTAAGMCYTSGTTGNPKGVV